MPNTIPVRLRDLDPNTILWLDRLDSKQREALVWAGNLDEEQRERLDRFLELDAEHFDAGLAVIRLWIRLNWLSSTSMWIILTVAGLLLAVTQIMEQLKWPTKP